MNFINREILLRVLVLMIGLTIAHLGVTFFLLADLGTDPFNVMVQGIFRTISAITGISWLTHGSTHMSISFLIIIALLLTDRSYIRIGTILCMFCGGPIIDFFAFLLTPLFTGEVSLTMRIIVNCIGCIILAYGMTIVIKSEAGTGPNDLVAVVISDKLQKKFSIIRMGVDIFFALAGIGLGGTIGIGTVICAFIVGPVAGIFLPINERLIKRFIA